MKIRIKFSKTGAVKYIGHLDVMRYFQKLNRRAGLDVKYSSGFSPHQIMSFAAPLGVGLESTGEYVDIELNSTMTTKEAIEAMNSTSVEGIQILDYVLLKDDAKNAMSIVTSADYTVSIKDECMPDDHKIWEKFNDFISQECIVVTKNTKKSTSMADIKPMIIDATTSDNKFYLKLMTGSCENLKPDLVMKAFFEYAGYDMPLYCLNIIRTEVYGRNLIKDSNGEIITDEVIPLWKFGERIE